MNYFDLLKTTIWTCHIFSS